MQFNFVEEGRTVYRNLQRAIAFILPISAGESMTILIAILLQTQLPILPLQILWMNMVGATALTLPLGFDRSYHSSEQIIVRSTCF
jgi:Ca2+-transporting ATPase